MTGGEEAPMPARRAARGLALWRRLFAGGPQSIADGELVGLVLADQARSVPACALGRELLARFGSLAGVGDALPHELMAVGGVSAGAAARLAAAAELGRRCLLAAVGERPAILGPGDVAQVVRAAVGGAMHESFHVLLLDTGHRVMGHEEVTRGTLASCLVDARSIFRTAVRRAAAAVVLAHNHPSGDPTPSPEDFEVTWRLADAGRLLGIDVLDHVVVGRPGHGRAESYVSLRELGAFDAGTTRPLLARYGPARDTARPAQTADGSS